MEENRRIQLEAKLKEMIKHFDQAEAKRRESIQPSATRNVFRRKAGQKAKRFSI